MFPGSPLGVLLLFSVALVVRVLALPTGAPTLACNTLTPQHAGLSQTECGQDCPFSLSVVAVDGEAVPGGFSQYRCGATHTSKLINTVMTFQYMQSCSSNCTAYVEHFSGCGVVCIQCIYYFLQNNNFFLTVAYDLL